MQNSPTLESFKAFHERLLRRRVKQHVGVFHTVAQGFAPSSVHQSFRSDAAAFIHCKIIIEKKKKKKSLQHGLV